MVLWVALVLGLVIVAFVLLRVRGGHAAEVGGVEGAVAPSRGPRPRDDLPVNAGRACGVDFRCGDDLYCDGGLFSYNSPVAGCCNPVAASGLPSYYCSKDPAFSLGSFCVPEDVCARSGHSCRAELFAANFTDPGCCVEKDSTGPTEACRSQPWFDF